MTAMRGTHVCLLAIACAACFGVARAQSTHKMTKADFDKAMKDYSNWGRWGKSDQLGAINWADLGDRMRYILELFRSRQQDQRLFEPPFNAIQTASIAASVEPDGEL